MSEMKKVLVLDVDDDIESLIIHHPSGDEEVIVLGSPGGEDTDGTDNDESADRL